VSFPEIPLDLPPGAGDPLIFPMAPAGILSPKVGVCRRRDLKTQDGKLFAARDQHWCRLPAEMQAEVHCRGEMAGLPQPGPLGGLFQGSGWQVWSLKGSGNPAWVVQDTSRGGPEDVFVALGRFFFFLVLTGKQHAGSSAEPA
jgi:hypothetical protein